MPDTIVSTVLLVALAATTTTGVLMQMDDEAQQGLPVQHIGMEDVLVYNETQGAYVGTAVVITSLHGPTSTPPVQLHYGDQVLDIGPLHEGIQIHVPCPPHRTAIYLTVNGEAISEERNAPPCPGTTAAKPNHPFTHEDNDQPITTCEPTALGVITCTITEVAQP